MDTKTKTSRTETNSKNEEYCKAIQHRSEEDKAEAQKLENDIKSRVEVMNGADCRDLILNVILPELENLTFINEQIEALKRIKEYLNR